MSDSTTSKSQGLATISKPEKLADVVFETLRTAITDKSLLPGAQVAEASFAKQLNVSKTPVREALLALRQIGLIEDWGKRGGRVIMPSKQIILNTSQIREMAEVFISRAAAVQATLEQKKSILDLAYQTEDAAKTKSPEEFPRVNRAFHVAIADTLENPKLSSIIHDTLCLVAVIRMRDLPWINYLPDYAEDHIRIAKEIERGDPEGAGQAALEHVQHGRDHNLACYESLKKKK